jgi:hypothetical protein
MKCNKSFILAYNKLFRYLNEYDDLQEFWPLLSDAILGRLRFLVETKGIAGMVEYWSDTLLAEGADCQITADYGPTKSLTIAIRDCPSLKKIKEAKETPCFGYCSHCDHLYAPLLKEFGYKYTSIMTCGGCVIKIEETKK